VLPCPMPFRGPVDGVRPPPPPWPESSPPAGTPSCPTCRPSQGRARPFLQLVLLFQGFQCKITETPPRRLLFHVMCMCKS
jgi:hypothetical protein